MSRCIAPEVEHLSHSSYTGTIDCRYNTRFDLSYAGGSMHIANLGMHFDAMKLILLVLLGMIIVE